MTILLTLALAVFATLTLAMTGSAFGPVAAIILIAALWLPKLLRRTPSSVQRKLVVAAGSDAPPPTRPSGRPSPITTPSAGSSRRFSSGTPASHGNRRDRDNSVIGVIDDLDVPGLSFPSLLDGGGRKRDTDDGAAGGWTAPAETHRHSGGSDTHHGSHGSSGGGHHSGGHHHSDGGGHHGGDAGGSNCGSSCGGGD